MIVDQRGRSSNTGFYGPLVGSTNPLRAVGLRSDLVVRPTLERVAA
jgi:hypothetical protein